MRRPPFARLLTSWTRKDPRRPSADAPARETTEPIDGLFEFLRPDPPEGVDGGGRSPWEGEEPAPARIRQERFLRTVDRAIAELAGPRRRRSRSS